MATPIFSKKKYRDTSLVISLYKQGISLEAIAEKLCCSTTPIIDILERNDIQRRPMGFRYGKNHWNYKSGRFFSKYTGYYWCSMNGKKILEHHYVWIRENQMPIPKGCVIHHKNLDKTDNRIENLMLLPKDIHDLAHWALRKGKVV